MTLLAFTLAAFFYLYPGGDPWTAGGCAVVGVVLALPRRWREAVLDRVLGRRV